MKTFIRIVSLNRHYLAASIVYLGMTLLMLGIAADLAVYARSGSSESGCSYPYTWTDESGTYTETVPGCPEGHACCTDTYECVAVD